MGFVSVDEIFDRVDAQQWVDAVGPVEIREQVNALCKEIVALKAKIEQARYLIEQIGTTGAERTDVIRKAEEWLKS